MSPSPRCFGASLSPRLCPYRHWEPSGGLLEGRSPSVLPKGQSRTPVAGRAQAAG